MMCETDRIEEDNLKLIDFSKEDDYLIAFPFRDSLEDFRLSVSYENVNECEDGIKLFRGGQVIDHIQSESMMEPRRPSFLRKSLAWDSAFFNSAGLLNHKELFMVNKGFKKDESKLNRTKKYVRPPRRVGQDQTPSDDRLSKDKVSSQPKLISSRLTNKVTIEVSDEVKIGSKTRKAGLAPDQTVSKRSRWGDSSGLPKPTSFTSPTEKISKVHRSYESSSSASSSSKHSSKFIRRKISPRNMKPTTSPSLLQYPSSSTCSSTSVSSIDGCLLESISPTSIMHQNSAVTSDFQSPLHVPHQNIDKRKFTSEYATRTSMGSLPFSGGPKRKIKSSGLRMPSPKIGFFDEPMLRGSMQVCIGGQSSLPHGNRLKKFQPAHLSPSVSTENCSKDGKTFNGEHDGRKVVASCSKLKPDGHTPKERSRNGMNTARKRQKDDGGSYQGKTMIDMKKKQDQCVLQDNEKENVCDFEDQVNGLSRSLEVIDLDSDVVAEVKVSRVALSRKYMNC